MTTNIQSKRIGRDDSELRRLSRNPAEGLDRRGAAAEGPGQPVYRPSADN